MKAKDGLAASSRRGRFVGRKQDQRNTFRQERFVSAYGLFKTSPSTI
jgi:hypothetical protein